MEMTQQGHWQAIAHARKERRAEGRRRGTEALRHAGIEFAVLDGGWHLRIEAGGQVIDYTPGSDTWRVKGQTRLNAGALALIHFIKTGAHERKEP